MSSVKITPELQIDHELLKAQKQELWSVIIELDMRHSKTDASTKRAELLNGLLIMLDVLDDECEAASSESQPTVSADN